MDFVHTWYWTFPIEYFTLFFTREQLHKRLVSFQESDGTRLSRSSPYNSLWLTFIVCSTYKTQQSNVHLDCVISRTFLTTWTGLFPSLCVMPEFLHHMNGALSLNILTLYCFHSFCVIHNSCVVSRQAKMAAPFQQTIWGSNSLKTNISAKILHVSLFKK